MVGKDITAKIEEMVRQKGEWHMSELDQNKWLEEMSKE